MEKNITSRAGLKKLFSKGKRPTEESFATLIDSTLNKNDDKIELDKSNGLHLYPSGDDGKLFSIFNSKTTEEAKWSLLNRGKGLSFEDLELRNSTPIDEGKPALFLSNNGQMGVGTNNPKHELEVNGNIASSGRVGNFTKVELKADGEWHDVFQEDLNHCQAFEIMAFAKGPEKKGRYCLLHAVAISTYGKSKPKISKTSAHFGSWWNTMRCRWVASSHNEYNFQLKTRRNYGSESSIYVRVTKLWDNSFIDDFS